MSILLSDVHELLLCDSPLNFTDLRCAHTKSNQITFIVTDAKEVNKSRYSGVVGCLNILCLLASFAREIHYTTDANSRHGRGFCSSSSLVAKCIPVFVKVRSSIVQLRVSTYNHNYFVLHCCFRFSASARNHVTARASSWLVNVARISAKVQIFQLALFVRIVQQDCLSRLCIDLTCNSFESGVNAPLVQNERRPNSAITLTKIYILLKYL